MLIAEGHATIVDDADVLSAVDRLSQKYVDPYSGATAGYPQSPDDVPYRIDVERIMIWEYGVVDTRTDFVASDRVGNRRRNGDERHWIRATGS